MNEPPSRYVLGLALVLALGLPCTTPLRAQALFQLGSAEAQPGQSGVVIPLTITAGADGVGAWRVAIQYDPEAMAVERIEQAWPAEVFSYQPNSLFTERGVVEALAAATLLGDETWVLFSGQTETVALVHLCILPTALQGVYTVGFAPRAAGRPLIGVGWATRYSAWRTFNGSGRIPALVPGTIQVRGEPVAASSCVADGPAWVPPPAVPEISFALAAPSRAAPGDQVTVTWNISTNSDLLSYHAAIEYDEAVLAFEAGRVNREWLAPSTRSVAYVSAEDGNLVITVLTDLFLQTTMPAGPARLAAEIDFTVNPQTQASATEIVFVDANAVALLQEHPSSPERTSVEVQVDPAGGGAMLAIQREAEFLRGDVNDDGAIDISDAVTTLEYLFTGDEAVACADAADANDDRTVDISDPVAELRYLFRGGPPLPPPFGACGADRTDDDPLGCNSYTGCP